MPFLKAQWKHLILANYIVNPDILKPYLPNKTKLDFYNGNCYVSLVGFMFKNTKVLGIKWPFYTNFEEVNMRFYVTHNNKRGVVFVKEIVPKALITFIANTLYKEHYQTCKMSHNWQFNKAYNKFSYLWKQNAKNNSISVCTEKEITPIKPNTEAEFITEHYFGYTKHHDTTFEYEVQHEPWRQHKVKNYNINVDFKANYGNNFEFLNTQKPHSVVHAIGSNIKVLSKQKI